VFRLITVDQPQWPPGATASGERLHRLLDALVGIGSDLDLPATLERIVLAACDLTDARYGALGVIGDDHQLTEFIAAGLDPATQAAIGSPPTGRGVLGLLLDDPHPVRLTDIGRHPRSAGFPAHHPAMRGFLGVPVKVADQVFGNLYLADKRDGTQFTPEDEEAMVALATAAGAAVERVRLHSLAQRRQRWLAATAEVVQAVGGAPDRDAALAYVARRACEVAEAALVMVLLYDEAAGKLTVATVDSGEAIDGLSGTELDVANTAFERALREQRQIAIDDIRTAAPWPVCLPALRAAIAPFGGIRGVLLVAYPGAARDEDELTLLSLFAGQAAVTLDREQARADREAVLVLSERERIARDLHDVVIQRLFGIGLSLQTAASLAIHPEVGVRTRQAVEDLDATIRAIRSAIFELRSSAADSIRAQLRFTADWAAKNLGFRPTLRLDGPIDTTVPPEIAADLIAVVVEALSNVVRHSAATAVDVSVSAGVDRVTAIVADNGRGGAVASGGLANLQGRAEQRGGEFSVVSAVGDGTTLVWSVPLP